MALPPSAAVTENSTNSTSSNEDQPLEKVSSSNTPVCKLCLELLKDGLSTFTISSCQCTFCKQCMQCYVEVLVHDSVVLSISCPDADCKLSGMLNVLEIKQLVLPDTFKMYQQLKFEQEISTDPHRTFCPAVTCSTVCHVCHKTPNTGQLSKSFPVSCPTCHLQFCYICKAKWKTNHKCSNYPLTFGSEFQKFQARAGLTFSDDVAIKRCPVCNVFIEKNNGCAQMTCRNCSHIFCWYCLKVLDNDFLLRHYDKGPCRDKLGHSRSQVVRHRLGVVALFAAFFLLLAVASPVLLLAAPVVLCYKCWKCNKRKQASSTSSHTRALSASHRRSSVVLEVRLTQHESPVRSNTDQSTQPSVV